MAQQPIQDLLIRDNQPKTLDLFDIFGAGSHGFTVTTSDGAVVAASIENGILTIDPQALGHADIRISGLTADGAAISDNFRARVAGEHAYTIAVLPDTQGYTMSAYPNHIFGDMTQWLADNAESRGIEFVVHVGDVTNNNNAAQWQIAEEALRKLDGHIPYSLLPGNHDQAANGSASDHSTDLLDTLFSPENQAATNPDTFGGVYDREPTRSANNYHTFTAPDGTKWLVLSLEFAPRDDVMRWAGEVVEAHLDHRVLVATHNYMSYSGRNDELAQYGGGPGTDYGLARDPEGYNSGENIWLEFVSKYPNISMVFSGHIILGDGAETSIGYTQHDNPVLQMLVNYQNGVTDEITGGNAGNGAIRLITIDPDNNTVHSETYLANLDEYLDGYRGQAEPDRDGLQGTYLEHEEVFTDIDLGAPELRAQADAGSDLFVSAASGAKTADVLLDGRGSLNPDLASHYTWLDEDGRVIASGIDATVALGAGRHMLTLQVEDAQGHVTSDRKLVVVGTDDTLLVDNFNDGNADGWSKTTNLAGSTTFVPASELGLPALPGGDADVMSFPALPLQGQGYVVKPGFTGEDGGTIDSYTIAFDVFVPGGQGVWFPFFQADVNNADDGELFVNAGKIGNSGKYFGNFSYDQWHRVVLTVQNASVSADNKGIATLNIYLDGAKIGSINYNDARSHYQIDPEKGFLLFNDNTVGATSSGYINSLLLTDKVMTDTEVAALGGPKAGGILTEAPDGSNAFQLDFGSDNPYGSTFGGDGSLALFDNTQDTIGNWIVRGTHAAPGTTPGTAEGELYDVSDSAAQMLLWNAPEAKAWHDYTFDVTARSTDDDEIGVIFYFKNEDNYYRFETYGAGNYRRLIKVENGVQSTLAEVAKGYTFDAEIDFRVAVAGDRIEVFMNGKSVFGPLTDTSPLSGGTVGVYSNFQRGTSFDNVVVNKVELTAHGEGTFRAIDTDGDGTASVALTAGDSYGPADIVSYSWQLDGHEVAQGRDVTLDLPVGTEGVTLVVTDATGATSSDFVKTDVAGRNALLASDDFGADSLADGTWQIVDQEGSVGVSDWQLQNGHLEQLSGIYSDQLTRNGNGVWGQGWSPLGDGVNVLRKGTIALYGDEAATAWKDYSIEATIEAPSGANANGLGFVFYYQDEQNYYKLELDSVGGLWNLVVVKDGIEEVLGRVFGKYAPGSALQLRVDIVDHVISAYLDGEAIFPAPIEDRELSGGTFGLYTWKSAGVSFDDVKVVSLAEGAVGGPILGTAGDDELIGTSGDDVISGLAGDDELSGLAGNDVIDGGEGDDTLDGGEGNDTLLAGAGIDDDDLFGGAGDDKLTGNGGDNVLDGGEGLDTADYSADTAGVDINLATGETFGDETGADELSGIEIVLGGSGNDTLTGDALANTLNGGAGNDTLEGGAGDDVLIGGEGSDTLVLTGATGAILLDLATGSASATGLGSDAFSGIEAFHLGAGDDVATIVAGAAPTGPIDGGNGHDTLVLTGAGVLGALTGIEELNLQGNWTVTGTGADVAFQDGAQTLSVEADFTGTLSGFAQEDRVQLLGFAGSEATLGAGNLLTITGAGGAHTLQFDPAEDFSGMAFSLASDDHGGSYLSYGPAATDDVLTGGNGGDVLDGGAGDDTISGGAGNDTLHGGLGTDSVDGGSGDDLVTGGAGNDALKGGSGIDHVDGGDGNDVIDAGSDNDVVLGGAGDDQIKGGSGDDVITGGAGNDLLSGGSGHDSFVFASGFGHDTIGDFKTAGSSADVLEFASEIFADFDAAYDAADQIGSDIVFTIDADTSLTLKGVQLASLAQDDFRFA